MIYFDNEKNAYAYEISNYIATTTDENWANYADKDNWNIIDGEFVDITNMPEYQQEQASKREADFKSQFFEIPAIEDVFIGGFYRKKPKGYSSAVESLNTAFNVVTVAGGLPENTLIFYTEPDYTDPEQCTEEWLVAHQFKNEAMTPTEFGQFYAAFMTVWNTQEQ